MCKWVVCGNWEAQLSSLCKRGRQGKIDCMRLGSATVWVWYANGVIFLRVPPLGLSIALTQPNALKSTFPFPLSHLPATTADRKNYQASEAWNKLLVQIRWIRAASSFKITLKQHLLDALVQLRLLIVSQDIGLVGSIDTFSFFYPNSLKNFKIN